MPICSVDSALTVTEFDGFHPQTYPKVITDNIQEIEHFARVSKRLSEQPKFRAELTYSRFMTRCSTPCTRYSPSLWSYPKTSSSTCTSTRTVLKIILYMKYGRFTEAEQETLAKGDGLWSYGHTDLGTLTLLFRQPVAALQIKDHLTGDWKWAKPLDGSLTVNTCDALSFLTGNYIKSTVHRVS
jgi:isopenicillin N synthase-like dioxygenase